MSTDRCPTVDPARCPLCGQPNACGALADPQGRCWCVDARIDAALRAGVPVEAVGRACICAACVRAASAASAEPMAPSSAPRRTD